MEVVRNFNNELSSLYEVKPPISKAKMTQITKSAIKGLKYYKHIVQSVEKFIQKCRPEYKVPGLYVIDSIVRQSRHQFGPEKDVFAPRFAKNIATTFQNLFKCTEEDRSKVVRVLNLWQKNSVFPSDVIQPLLDMANPNTNEPSSQPPTSEIVTHNSKSKSAELAAWKNWPQANEDNFEDGHGYAEMSTRNLEKFTKANAAGTVNLEAAQLPQNMPVKNEMPVQEDNTVKFNRKLLDFDYGDEDEEEEIRNEGDQMPTAFNPLALSMAQNLLSNPELLQQLQQMQQTIQQSEALKSELGMAQPPQQQSQIPMEPEMKDQYSPDPPDEHVPLPESSAVSAMPYQEPHPSNVLPFQFEAPVNYPAQPPQVPVMEPVEMPYQHSSMVTEDDIIQSSQVDEDDRVIYSMPGEPPLPPQDLDERAIGIPTLDDHIPKDDSRSRSDSRTRRSGRHRSRSRSPRRRKSRSRSRSRSRRKRSRSRDRERERERQREREREREREYERRKKGIPPIKKNHMTVCSTTLWMGHVPKTMAEEDINSILCEYGTVSSIDMIPPRGCAYVAMDRRQDAYRALQKLKNLKLRGSSIKVAWAPGKGVKGKEYKDYWEVDSGVSYIPYDKLPNDAESLDLLEEGGFIDEDSMPSDLLEIRRQEKEKMVQMEADVTDSSSNRLPSKDAVMSSAPVAAVTSSVMPPSSMGMPLVMPQMMQTPQYGMVLPSQPPMVMPLPVGVPPPNPMMMVQPPSQTVLAGTPLPVGSVPQMPHLSLPHQSVVPSVSSVTSSAAAAVPSKTESAGESSTGFSAVSGDATPTEEDGTSVSSPGVTSTVQASSVGSGASVSVAPLGPHAGAQFAGVGHHGVVRPMLPVLPPVSSAGAPIPFPPPQVGFGFPPPPIRPTIPSQSLPGVMSVPNSPFPWMQKASAPAFSTYGDSDMRFTVHGSSTASPVNMRPVTPAAAQQAAVDMASLSSQPSVNQQHAFTQSTSQPVSTSSQMSPLKGKEADSVTTASTSDGFGSKADMSSSSHSHMDTFAVADDVQSPFDKSSGDVRRMNKDEPRDVMHAYSDADLAAIPRFPGPPDFHPVPGAMRMPWLHGPPGPRFPPAFNPNASPFPPRGGGPRPMDIDFFRHQVPRLHLPGSLPPQQPQQQQQRWKNDNFSPQRGQDHYPGRRDYRDSHYDDEDQGRRHRSRDDWGRRRERWEERGRRNDDRDESSSRSGDRGSRSEERRRDRETSSSHDSRRDRDEKDSRRDEKKTSSSSSDKEPAKSEKSSVPKPVQNSASSLSDLADDLFRLQSYGGRGRVANVPNFKSSTSKGKKETKNREGVEEPSKDQSGEKSSKVETQEKKVVDASDCSKGTDGARTESGENGLRNEASSQDVSTASGDTATLQSSGQENRSRRDRDRKRSRWGRTLSQEREFQQQKQEMERQAQNDTAVLHPDERGPCHNREGDIDASSNANVASSGVFEIENSSAVPNSTVMVEPSIEGPCKGVADTNSIAVVEPSSSFSEAPCEVTTMSSSFTNETPMELSDSTFVTDVRSES